MTNAMKMAMLRSVSNNGGNARGEMRSGGDMEMRNEMRGGMRGEMRNEMQNEMQNEMRGEMRGGYGQNEMRGEMENAFRDRRGRRHYDNGRFAPMRGEMEMEGEGGGYGSPRMTDTFEGREVLGFRAGGNMVEFPKGDEMQNRRGSMEQGKGEAKGGKLDKHMIESWLMSMKNTDGSKGPHWSFEQIKNIVKQKEIEHDPLMFWAAINMMYSDYSEVAQKYGLNNQDYYIDLAKAFLDDEDVHGDKLSKYYFGVIKR